MTSWRPAPGIRLKALGLHWRGDRLLAAEVRNDAGRLKGVRPLGGTVEFGETAADAVIREFREELGLEITTRGAPVWMENRYTHEGQPGHEIIALFDIDIPAATCPADQRFAIIENGCTLCFAQWFALSDLDGPGQPRLYPDKLKTLLSQAGRGHP